MLDPDPATETSPEDYFKCDNCGRVRHEHHYGADGPGSDFVYQSKDLLCPVDAGKFRPKRGTILARTDINAGSPIAHEFCGHPVRAIAVAGAVGDWAAYVGLSECSDASIYSFGGKLGARHAAALFPELNAGAYRP